MGQQLAPSQPQMLPGQRCLVQPHPRIPWPVLVGLFGLFAEQGREPCVQLYTNLMSPKLLAGRCCHCPHLSDEETEARRGEVTGPKWIRA